MPLAITPDVFSSPRCRATCAGKSHSSLLQLRYGGCFPVLFTVLFFPASQHSAFRDVLGTEIVLECAHSLSLEVRSLLLKSSVLDLMYRSGHHSREPPSPYRKIPRSLRLAKRTTRRLVFSCVLPLL
ncbi:hypothetical protein PLICRDRAFT_433095 [Plicaturopsis crispa FD-325 SS-3]|uniref:Unplaced genomic scaffold PLICRscaffold_20, whole genome shotgun sequence n=1 Tax=Plicaturopsis crispa FD-325 SS-3 TaxID=944288 RepID=A0A0C9T3P9_PLICR|nr:hypothetical protein PLICRDRAFT_433095 [Plicaturopsis crispa FD-325 SS-3]